jgi:hypothetical protein
MRGKDDSVSMLRSPANTLALALLLASCGDASCPGTSGDDGGRPPTCPSCGDACSDRYDGFHDVAPEPACPTVADEICNARDDDCDGRTDEGLWCVDRAGPYYPPAGAPNAVGGLWVGGADDVWALGGPVGSVEAGRNQRAMHWDGTA